MKPFAIGDKLHRCVGWAVAVLVGALSLPAQAQTPIVTYYPGSGALSLNDSGANSDPNLYGLTVYVATPSDLPTSGTLATLSDWSSGTASTQTGGNVMNWGSVSSGTTETDALPAGVYNLAQLPTGLSALAFGYSYSQHTPFGTQTYIYGPDDSPGAVVFNDFSGANAGAAVTLKRSVPSENDWKGAPNGSWNIAGNWSLAHAASGSTSGGETASFITASLAGTVTLDHNQSAGSLWFDSSAPYTIASGSGAFTLTLSNTANIWIDSGLHAISAPLNLSGSLTVNAQPAGGTAPTATGLTVSGQIGGTAALYTVGPGILYLSNTNNTYNGSTTITAGTLSAAGPGSLGASGSVTISNATLDFSGGGGTLNRAIALTGANPNAIQVDSGTMTLSGAISGSGSLTKAGNATLALSNSANTFGGGANVVAGTLQIRSSTALPSASTVTVGGGAALDLYGSSPSLATISGAGTVTNNNPSTTSTLTAAYVGGAASYSAAIQDGAGKIALSVPNGGMLTLSNTANAFSGGSSVTGGTLGISADGNLGAPASGVALNNGTLQGSTNFTLGSGRTISLAGSSAIAVMTGQSVAIAGVVSGTTLTKTDGGMLSLTGANNYSGGTVINGGTLAAANDGSLGAAGGSVTINNATLQIGGGTSNRPLVVGSGYPVLAVSGGTLTEGGVISGGASALQLTGSGTLVLTNPSNNFNGINLEAGTLLNNDSTGSSLGGGPLTVTGGTLAGSGTFPQQVTMNSGGNLMAGSANAMGTMTLQGGLTLIQGANSPTWTLKIDGAGNSDSLDFGLVQGATNSSLLISGMATLVVTGTPLPSTTQPYTIITNAQLGSNQTALNLSDLAIKAPLGFTGSFSQSQYYFNGNFPNGLDTVTLSFASATAWIVSGTHNWSADSSWSSYVPAYNNSPLAGCTAMFGANGSGTVVLPGSGATTYVNTLVFANSSNSYTLTAGSGGSTLDFLPSATAPAGGAIPEGGAYVEVVYGSHTIAVAAQLGGALDVSTLDSAAAITFSGDLSGKGSLTLEGSGTLNLTGSNSYSGSTTIRGGTLGSAAAGGLSTSSACFVNGGVLDVRGGPQTVCSLNVAASGALNLYVGSALTSTGSANLGGTLNVYGSVASGGTVDLINYPYHVGSFSPGALPANCTLDYLANQLDIVNTNASPGPSQWTPTGSGSGAWTANLWSSNGVPNGPQALAVIDAANGAPVTAILDRAITVGTLQLASSGNSSVTISATGGYGLTLDNGGSTTTSLVSVSQGTATIIAPLTLNGNLNISPSAGATLTIMGDIGQTAPSSLTLTAAGELILAGSNGYTGGTAVEEGTLDVVAPNALPSGSNLSVGSGAASLFGAPVESAPLMLSSNAANPVPEPSCLALLAGLAACAAGRWLRWRVKRPM